MMLLPRRRSLTRLFSLCFVLFISLSGSVPGQAQMHFGPPTILHSHGDAGQDYSPLLVTDASGTWLATWKSTANQGAAGLDYDVFFARSTDGGATWSFPEFLNRNAFDDSGNDDVARTATDSQGHWVAVWHSDDDLGGSVGTDVDILVARSDDNALTWSAAAPLHVNAASDSGEDRQPGVATDGLGTWVAVWSSTEDLEGSGTDFDILVAVSVDDGRTWSAPQLLNSNAGSDTGDDTHPTIQTDASGAWVTVWRSDDKVNGNTGDDVDLYVSRSIDGGLTWSPLETLNGNATTDTGNDGWHSFQTDGDGTWMVVWSSNENLEGAIGEDNDILFSRSTDAGQSWAAPAAVNANASTDGGNDNAPSITGAGSGQWLALWQSDEELGSGLGTDLDILGAFSTDNGETWSPVMPLHNNAGTDSGNDGAPLAATDRAGQWIAVWRSDEDLNGTAGTDVDVFCCRLGPATGNTWTDPAVLNRNGEWGYDFAPCLVTDGSGTWMVFWRSDHDLNSTAGIDWDIFLTRSIDNGNTWSPTATLNTNSATDTGYERLTGVATDGAGRWIALWFTEDNWNGTVGDDLDLFLTRSDDNGLTWSAPELFNPDAATDTGDDRNALIRTDGKGNWVVIWQSSEDRNGAGTDLDLFVSISSDNGLSWSAPATLNSNAETDTENDSWAQLEPDGTGHWIAIWRSTEDMNGYGPDGDIFLSRSTDNGRNWTAVTALHDYATADTATEERLGLATDGRGNWIAVWSANEDWQGQTGTDGDIFLSRSSDHGVTWTAPEILNTNASEDNGLDFAPSISTDGNGLWLVTWQSNEDLNGAGPDEDLFYAYSTDHGATWSDPDYLDPAGINANGVDFPATHGADRSGRWLVVWPSNEDLDGDGGDNDILVSEHAPLLPGGITVR